MGNLFSKKGKKKATNQEDDRSHGGPQAPPKQPAQRPMPWAPDEGRGRPSPPNPASGGSSTMPMYPQAKNRQTGDSGTMAMYPEVGNKRSSGDRSLGDDVEHAYLATDSAARHSKHIPLELQSWFFGEIDVERCVRVLGDPNVEFGTFLIRDSTSKEDTFCLSVKAETSRGPEIYSIRIEQCMSRTSGQLTYESMHDNTVFPSIEELIQHYQMNGIMTKGNVLHVGEGVTNGQNNDYNRSGDRFEIMESDITDTGKRLGAGQFGIVTRGNLKKGNQTTVAVALKQLRDVGREQLEEFEKEVGVLKMVYHENIVTFYGVCKMAGASVIVTELMSKGDLHQQLVRSRTANLSISESDMIYYALAIAKGMEFLESKEIVHRDLAARNVLLGDHHLVKINDFGLSRLTSNMIYIGTGAPLLPLKWTAPEGYNNRFTSKSDVWSYGILLTEIVTRGTEPYPDVNSKTIEVRVKDQGMRMTKEQLGPECSDELYRLMEDCWQEDPEQRPNFQKIVDRLSKLNQTVAPIKM